MYQTTGLRLGRQRAIDKCLEIVDRFHDAAGKFDMALSRKVMEIRRSRLPNDSVASQAQEAGLETDLGRPHAQASSVPTCA